MSIRPDDVGNDENVFALKVLTGSEPSIFQFLNSCVDFGDDDIFLGFIILGDS